MCFLCFLSDCAAYRYTDKGSLLIISVVKVFNHHAHEDHVEELFTMVCLNSLCNSSRQTAWFVSVSLLLLLLLLHLQQVSVSTTQVMHDVQQFSKANRMQMPTKDRCTLHSKFYFYPGHW